MPVLTTISIDINSDLGEGFGPFQVGDSDDEALFAVITSANVACGFHGGDPAMMATTVARARESGVAIGAHPSFPDRVGFGRRLIRATEADIHADVLYQVAALAGFATAAGVPLAHVKAHGALYNAAVGDEVVARAIASAVQAFDAGLMLYAMPGSALARAGAACGLRVVREAFADRAYHADGSLVSRSRPDGVIHDVDQVAERMLRLVTTGEIQSIEGDVLSLDAETICVHSDTPGAVGLARAVRSALEAAEVTIQAPAP